MTPPIPESLALIATHDLALATGRRRLSLHLSTDAWVLAALVLLVGWLIVPPLAILVYGSVTDTPPAVAPHFTLDTLHLCVCAVAHLVGAGRIRCCTRRPPRPGAGRRRLSGMAGRAYRFARADFADLFALAPILMPSVLLISGWILLLGPKSGMLNLIARDWFGAAEPVFDIYSFWGMVWVGTLQELPLAFLWLWPAFRAMNPDLEEAAHVAGAGFFTTMRRITLPMLRPTIVGAWIIFFIYSLGALSVPLLIGLPAKIFLYSTEIYLAYRRVPSDLNIASAYSLMFLLVTVVSIWAYRRATGDSSRFVTVTGKAYRPRLIRLGRWQSASTALGVVLLLLVAGLPLFVLVWNAFLPYPQAPSIASIKLLTGEELCRRARLRAGQASGREQPAAWHRRRRHRHGAGRADCVAQLADEIRSRLDRVARPARDGAARHPGDDLRRRTRVAISRAPRSRLRHAVDPAARLRCHSPAVCRANLHVGAIATAS